MPSKKNQKKGKQLPSHKVYDLIAESFDKKRSWPWQEVEEFIKSLPKTTLALDLGSGNGRHTLRLLQKNIETVALDLSYNILQVALENQLTEKKGYLLGSINATILDLPFKSQSFDTIIVIAVIHHLQSIRERKTAVTEITRILKPGGKLFVSCWQKTHPRFAKEDLRGQIQAGKQSIYVPWTLPSGEKILRYYYLFEPEEFQHLFDSPELIISNSKFSNHNLFLTITKKKA
ncbi:MAG: class I SAM-dependent methyltransferase [Asgard group archaeon]|nr:class I SAM-dependent methyltransferase [Asgard group archaeon]